ncbi:AAA family ATPase [Arcicella rigui]|uniref:AAA family ATPase n=1 Tax=Arcicella rigui TaxID=797020 RepID=A0ABU5QDJ7_9BACT|nr:AAA family ATPase [Arcicella rigui]MEA5140925.1 AAA family ATPase [Arcicella rigui]
MVKEVRIQNYKSVQDLTLELGRVNILIGANGCGKSNILEAIAFGSAAAEDKLGKEFLSARGIRVTEPAWMKSGFYRTINQPINIDFNIAGEITEIEINNVNSFFSGWSSKVKDKFTASAKELMESLMNDPIHKEILSKIKSGEIKIDEEKTKTVLEDSATRMKPLLSLLYQDISNFLIYAPENTFLRKFEEESQIEPLGIRGEGLFKLLSVMSHETPEEFHEIIENLELIDWFEGFEIPKDLVFTERRIRIKDRFLEEGLQYFDQRSANEGFLFLMFYFALFISKYTPKFFAIDNIDTSLNPKLCSELIKILSKLAKKHDKQVIFTTHNPAVLDGLNLNDDEQRLLVVSRNKDGHTKTKRVLPIATPEGEIPVRLSEQFMRGYIGGLPKNF